MFETRLIEFDSSHNKHKVNSIVQCNLCGKRKLSLQYPLDFKAIYRWEILCPQHFYNTFI